MQNETPSSATDNPGPVIRWLRDSKRVSYLLQRIILEDMLVPKHLRLDSDSTRWAAGFCMDGLSVYRRLQLLYDLVFSARVEPLLRLKPVRRQ